MLHMQSTSRNWTIFCGPWRQPLARTAESIITEREDNHLPWRYFATPHREISSQHRMKNEFICCGDFTHSKLSVTNCRNHFIVAESGLFACIQVFILQGHVFADEWIWEIYTFFCLDIPH